MQRRDLKTGTPTRASLPSRRREAYGPRMRFRVLGPLEVTGEDGPITLGGPRQRAVLAHLLVRANQVVPADALIDQVWGEEPPNTARGTLQAYVSNLRKALGPDRIEGRSPGYLLRAEPDEVDATRFELLLREGRGANGQPGRAEILREALGLWRGPAFADLAAEPGLAGEIARLDELRTQAMEARLAADLDDGRHGEVIGELESLTRQMPLRERLWGSLVLALYRSGRQADALAAYQRARDVLAEELGVDPSPDLQRLHERILRQDPDLELKGEALRGYRLLEQIGEGAFGVVHRAVQPQVGRDVAIKAIHPELANHPDFVRRFEREAQLVARLEHPHIVPLYDYWREPDGAYLVMRFLRGGSLAELLDEGPLEPLRAGQILDQVAAALAAAHRQGVVHRDVKPGNVLLDEDGNAYLTDFGVALDVGSAEKTMGTMLRGTPAYLSPEQIRLEPATPRSDVYALGIVLYEMLIGAYPFAETSLTALLDRHLQDPLPWVRDARPDLPPAVDQVIERATAKASGERFGDPLELASAFRSAVEGVLAGRAAAIEIRNPYKGLRAFHEADAGDFFGRGRVVERLVYRLGQDDPDARFLAVVGPSGSGKSSVVRAGLVPALRRGALPGSERWFVIEMVPGAHPFRELESALLAVAVEPPSSLMEYLERDELGLVDAVERVLPDPDGELLIVLDQLEEVFTLVDDDDERTRFLDGIRAAAVAPGSRIRVIATLRADFYDQPLSVPGFGDLLAARNEAITPMAPEELELAVVAPAERAGLVVEPMLLGAMIGDVAEQPGALPLVQYALTELAERAEGGVLTIAAYQDIGRVSGALARRADQLFDAMNDAGQVTCRQLFLRLVTLGEGSEDTRRRVRRSELVPLADTQTMEGVIEAFGRHRLLSFDRDPGTREPTVEIAHEALLRAWGRLRGWIDEARDDIRMQRQLAAAAHEWETSGHDASFLLRGARLDHVTAWTEATTLALSDDDHAFVEASVARRDEEVEAERTAQERERSLERRSNRRLRGLVAIGVAAALVASSLTVVAVGQRGRAEREARVATARELASAAVTNLEVDPQRSILLALAAVDTTRQDDTVLREAEEALHRAVAADREILTLPTDGEMAYSPDGRLIATGSAEDASGNDLFVWDALTGDRLRTLTASGDPWGLAFSPDGSRLFTLTLGGESLVHGWNTRSWRRLRTIAVGRAVPEPATLSISPDGRRLAVTGSDGIVTILDAASGREVQEVREPGWGFLGTTFSRDGTRIAAAPNFTGDSVLIWDIRTGRQVVALESGNYGVAYSPDGSRIATGHTEGRPKVYDALTGKVLLTLEGHTGPIWGLQFSPDGQLLATAGDDGTARIWDSRTGEELLVLHGHAGAIWGLRFSPDGRRIVTAGADRTARMWDITASGGRELLTVEDPAHLQSVAYSPDGSRLLTTSWRNVARLWDVSTGRLIASVPGSWLEAFSPDGDSFVTGWAPTLRDTSSGDEVRTMDVVEGDYYTDLAFSPDGSLIASGLGDQTPGSGTVTVWDASTGARVRTLGEPAGRFDSVNDVAFSPDGELLAGIAQTGAVHIWSVSSGQELLSIGAHLSNGNAVSFSPEGTMLATSGADGAAIWRIPSGERVATFTGHAGNIHDVAFSPDGKVLATANHDATASIWNTATGRELLTLFGHADSLTSVAFSPDGTRLATSSLDGTARVLALRVEDLVEVARAHLSREFSEAECRQYLHLDTCPASGGLASPLVADAGLEPQPDDGGPEGAYAVTIVPDDLRIPGLPGSEIGYFVGRFTLSLQDGSWRLHHDPPKGVTYATSGSYTISGNSLTLVTLMDLDPACFGRSWSARWAVEGTSLSFTNAVSDANRICVPEEFGQSVTAAIFESRPWQRVT